MNRGLLLALSLVGCVDAPHPFARATAPAVRRERARITAEESARRAASIAALPRIPRELYRTSRVAGADQGVVHVLTGPLRVDVRGARVTPADEALPRPVAYALPAARGWLFVTDARQVYASDTFTGRLRALRSFGCEPSPREPANALGEEEAHPELLQFVSHGRVAFEAPHNRGIFWSDGVTLHRMEVPDAVALAWSGEAHGALVVGYRTLKVTIDGGRTWRDVDLGAEVPLGVVGTAQRLVVLTNAGWRRLDVHGNLDPQPTWTEEPRTSPPIREGIFAVIDSLFSERGYERAPAPRAVCDSFPEGRVNSWRSPRFVAHLPSAGGAGQMPEWSVPRGRPAPFGTLTGRAFADAASVPAIVSVTRPSNPSPGHPVTLAWRGEDERGPFTARVQTAAPREIPVIARWNLVAATRSGLLLSIPAFAPGEAPGDDADVSQLDVSRLAVDLFWFSASGARRVGVSVSPEDDPLRAVALDDGGVALLMHGRSAFPEGLVRSGTPYVSLAGAAHAIRLGPDGAVLAHRFVAEASEHALVGIGQLGDRWGAVTAERRTPDTLTLLPFDGGELPFGRWTFEDAPAVCGPRASGGARLHLVHTGQIDDDALPITIGPQGDGPDFARPRLATFERAAGSENACVRRVWGVQHLDGYYEENGEDVGELYGALRLTARNGRLAGPFDDGRRISTISVDLSDRIGFMQDL